MVLQNIVILQNGVPARLHFFDHRIEKRTITSPDTGLPVVRETLVFDVDRLNGASVQSRYSTMSERLASQFAPYLPKKSYTDYEVIITQNGEGYLRRFTVQFVPQVG